MKDGYYLSAYVEIDPLGNLHHFAHRHDQNFALWELRERKVKLLDYWELERITGVKQFQRGFYNQEQFLDILKPLLEKRNLSPADIAGIWGTPQFGSESFSRHEQNGFSATYHAMCHLASSVFLDMDLFRRENILAFVLDGGSDIVYEKDTEEKWPFLTCWAPGNTDELAIQSAYSPGFLWDCMRCHYDIREGTLMALASASTSEACFDYEDILVSNNVKVKQSVYDQVYKIIRDIDELDEKDIGTKFNGFDPRFSKKDNRISMAMKIIQRMSERIMKRNIDEAIEKYGINPKETYLALSGGYALNCPCNTYLLDEYGFKGLIAPPCVSDSGMALGIGLYSFYNELGKDFSFALKNAYYGTQEDTEQFLEQGAYQEYIESVEAFDPDRAAEDIENGLVVWYNGRSEIGPRALGNRSIIGDPRKVETKDELNRVKQRQWWRPVAPIVMKEELSSWFERDYDSPYMLQAIKVRSEKAKEIEAIIHEDGSSRLQTIDEETGLGILYDVIRSFHKRTGVPIICNTSLNDRGEPIIDRIEEAMNFALRKGIHIIYINGTRLVLKNHQQYPLKHPLPRTVNTEYWTSPSHYQQLVNQLNPGKLDTASILYYVYIKEENPELLQQPQVQKLMTVRKKMFFQGLSPFLRIQFHELVARTEESFSFYAESK